MEKFTVASSAFNGSCHSQRYIFHGNIEIEPTSVPYTTTNIPPKPRLREPSFSSYLGPSLSQPQPPQSNKPVVVARELSDENEISIFDAEKYFNETNQHQKQQYKEQRLRPPSSFTHNNNISNLDRIGERDEFVMPPMQRNSLDSSSVDVYGCGYGRNYKTSRSVSTNPTVSSEASWNSQSGMLSNPPLGSMRNINLPSEQRKKSGSSGKWFFGRKCCFGEKSLQVQESLPEPIKTHHQFHDHGFHLNSNKPSLSPSKQRPKAVGIDKAPTLDEKTKEFAKSLGFEQRVKSDFLSENWAKDYEHSAQFTSENMFPATEIGRQVFSSSRSLGDTRGFSFPVFLNPIVAGKPPSQLDNSTRESLESLQLQEDLVKRKSMESQRCKLMSLSLDHDHRSFKIAVSPRIRAAARDEDVASDTSSDLFEIESFSTQTSCPKTYQPRDYNYLEEEISNYKARRQSSDEPMTPSVAPTEIYEPSEASIDWSVTTAEGFDRASLTNFSVGAASSSDYEETKFFIPSNGNTSLRGKMRGNGLLGCRCENAVQVGPNPEKHVLEPEKFCDYGASLWVEAGPVDVMSRSANISSMHPTRTSISKPSVPLARSCSARMYTHTLATH